MEKTKEAIALRRFICILLLLLLFSGLVGCMAAPAAQESFADLPIVTQRQQGETSATPTLAPEPQTPASTAPDTQALTEPAAATIAPAPETAAPETEPALRVEEDGVYDSKEEVALYIHLFGHLPSNYITKKEAEKLGWPGGELEPYAPGKCIGGSRFGNYEKLLPDAKGRTWTECDIDTLGAKSRGAKRIVFSNDGLIYYTDDHYDSFEKLYGEED